MAADAAVIATANVLMIALMTARRMIASKLEQLPAAIKKVPGVASIGFGWKPDCVRARSKEPTSLCTTA
jgi:hypothetical protein